MDPVVLIGAEGTGHKARVPLKFRAVESENPLPEERKKWCEEVLAQPRREERERRAALSAN